MGGIIRGVLIVATAFLFANGVFAQVSKEDQKCINTTNKSFAKIAKKMHKETERCIKDQSKGKNASATDCLAADAKGKKSKAFLKATNTFAKKCNSLVNQPLDPQPSALLHDFFGSDNIYFGEIGGALTAAKAEGLDKEARLFQMILGSDIDAAVIDATNKATKPAAKCQQTVIKQLFKCQDAKLKEFLKCKKTALKGGALTGQEVQDACLGTGVGTQPDPKGKIGKACVTKLDQKVSSKCTGKGIDPDDVLTGNCRASASNDTVGCLEVAVECDVCSSLNAVDGMHRDCDLFDNGLADQSCGACRNFLDQVAINSIGQTEAICILGCAGSSGCLTGCGIITTDPLCEACLEDTTVCAALGPGSACISLCLAEPASIDCQDCLRAVGCLDCFGVAP